MRSLTLTLIASSTLVVLLDSPDASATDERTRRCIDDNEQAQIALLDGDPNKALELANRCNSSECADVIRTHCEELAAKAKRAVDEASTAPAREPDPGPRVDAPEPPQTQATDPEPGAPRATGDSGPTLVPSLVLGGVAVAAAGSFAYFALRGRSREDDLECSRGCSDSELDPIGRDYLIADVSLAVSVLALAGSIYFFPWSDGDSAGDVAVGVGARRVQLRLAF